MGRKVRHIPAGHHIELQGSNLEGAIALWLLIFEGNPQPHLQAHAHAHTLCVMLRALCALCRAPFVVHVMFILDPVLTFACSCACACVPVLVQCVLACDSRLCRSMRVRAGAVRVCGVHLRYTHGVYEYFHANAMNMRFCAEAVSDSTI